MILQPLSACSEFLSLCCRTGGEQDQHLGGAAGCASQRHKVCHCHRTCTASASQQTVRSSATVCYGMLCNSVLQGCMQLPMLPPLTVSGVAACVLACEIVSTNTCKVFSTAQLSPSSGGDQHCPFSSQLGLKQQQFGSLLPAQQKCPVESDCMQHAISKSHVRPFSSQFSTSAKSATNVCFQHDQQ